MKPCAQHRKQLAALALNVLETTQAETVRAHLETCPGCRRYLAELSHLVQTLETTEIASDQPVPERFHRRLSDALGARQRARGALPAVFSRWPVLRWVLGPALGAAAALLLILSPVRPPVTGPAAPPRPLKASLEPAPTLANYERAAHRSLEAFDDMLSREAERRPVRAPLYTASAFLVAARLAE